MRQFSLQACILLSAIASAASASAQQSSEGDSTPSATPISKVEVKAKVDSVDLRRDDTASKIVLTHEEIVKYGDTNVFDVLKRVPGVTVGAATGRNIEIRMRGLGNGYTQILVNGERTAAGFSIESLPPDAIERIEIMRVSTAEYSTQAIAGTINIVLKKTIKVADRELKLSAGAGDGGGISPRIIYQASDRLDSFSYSVTTTAYRNNFSRDAPIEEESLDAFGRTTLHRDSLFSDRGHTSSLSVAPRINWIASNGDSITCYRKGVQKCAPFSSCPEPSC